MVKSGEKLETVVKSGKKWEKWGKVRKKFGKVGKGGVKFFFLIFEQNGRFGYPKITFDHSSCHFRSIRNFFFY